MYLLRKSLKQGLLKSKEKIWGQLSIFQFGKNSVHGFVFQRFLELLLFIHR